VGRREKGKRNKAAGSKQSAKEEKGGEDAQTNSTRGIADRETVTPDKWQGGRFRPTP